MPKLPKSKSRPWIPQRPQHMREVDNASFYNSKRWRALRNFFIQKNPLCAQCERDGVGPVGAQVIDHIKPISQFGMGVATDIKNLQALCHTCHNKKSGRESAQKRNETKTYVR
tara:strand:+ start:280 stop:618 length:339 start_codon:yes stop_codon:yes gene_type:complete